MAWLLLLLLAAGSPCSILNDWFGPLYITYERHGERPASYGNESDERVWLRLHNNTTCNVRIPAHPGGLGHFESDGTFSPDPQEGQEVGMDVWVSDPNGPLLQRGTALPANCFLAPGRAVVFSVAANLLKRGPIMIDIGYAWETSRTSDYGRIEHRIVFDLRERLKDEPDLDKWLAQVKEPPVRSHLSPEHPGTRLSGAPAGADALPSAQVPPEKRR